MTDPQTENINIKPTLKDLSLPVEDHAKSLDQWKHNTKEYASNNGIIAFVDEEGKYNAGPMNPELMDALEAGGYKKGEINVPFSNGEQMYNNPFGMGGGGLQKWKDLEKRAKNTSESREKQYASKEYSKKANELGIKDVIGEYLICDGDKLSTGETIEESHKVLSERLGLVGQYDTNNGIIAWVDKQGHLCATPVHENIEKSLEEAGYKKGSMNVPYSNGERSSKNKWDRLVRHLKTN